MVSVQVAGFGGEINLAEVLLILQLAFLAFTITNFAIFSNENVFDTLANKIIGWPSCQSAICLAPSEASVTEVTSGFSTLFENQLQPFSLFNAIFSAFDVLKGVIGLFVVITGLWAVIDAVYSWYFRWGVFSSVFTK